MSTILDALRKAAERRPAGPGDPGAVEPGSPATVAPPREDPEPVRTAVPVKVPDRPMMIPEPGPVARPSPAPTVASEPAPPPTTIETPAAAAAEPPSAPRESELPPPGDFPPSDEPSFLPADDDMAARRRKLVRAGMIVVVGIALGLLVGRRFLPESGTVADDLLSDAVLAKPVAKPDTKPTATAPDTAPPSADVQPAASAVANESGKEKPTTGEKGRGNRAEKQRRDGEKKKEGEPAADKPAVPATPTPTDAGSPIAAPVQPQQIRPKPAMIPDPAAATPPAIPPVPARPPAAAILPPPPAVASASPSVSPPAAVMPPPAAPIALPPPPDDAPTLSLLFIQWSSEPARRVASLRQSGGSIYIVHEGDIVQGLRIAVIRPAGVEVQWRGQSFLLPASRN